MHDQLTLMSANVAISGGMLVAVAVVVNLLTEAYYRAEGEFPGLSDIEFRRRVWPAVAAHRFFTRLFGDPGTTIKDKFTPRAVGVTMLISLVANGLAVWLIGTGMPEDMPPLTDEMRQTLLRSFGVFLLFNFLGDLVSVNITRHLVAQMASHRCNFVRYILLDACGIVLAIVVTIVPGVLGIIRVEFLGGGFHELFQWGVFGGSVIPGFLFIFAVNSGSLALAVLVVFSVFSVFVPTAIYLSIMFMRVFLWVLVGDEHLTKVPRRVRAMTRLATIVGNVFLWGGAMIAAIGA